MSKKLVMKKEIHADSQTSEASEQPADTAGKVFLELDLTQQNRRLGRVMTLKGSLVEGTPLADLVPVLDTLAVEATNNWMLSHQCSFGEGGFGCPMILPHLIVLLLVFFYLAQFKLFVI